MADTNLISAVVSVVALVATSPFWIRVVLYALYRPDVELRLGSDEAPVESTSVSLSDVDGPVSVYVVNRTRRTIRYDLLVQVDAEVERNGTWEGLVDDWGRGGKPPFDGGAWVRVDNQTVSPRRDLELPFPFEWPVAPPWERTRLGFTSAGGDRTDDAEVEEVTMAVRLVLYPSIDSESLHLPRIFGSIPLRPIAETMEVSMKGRKRGTRIGFQ